MSGVRLTRNCGFLTGRYFEIAFQNVQLCGFQKGYYIAVEASAGGGERLHAYSEYRRPW
jgi:hypothetical protein